MMNLKVRLDEPYVKVKKEYLYCTQNGSTTQKNKRINKGNESQSLADER